MTWKLHAPYRGVAKIVFRFDDGTTATIQPDADGRFEAPEIACPLAAIATKEYPTSWAPRRAWGRRILLRFYSGGSGENSMRKWGIVALCAALKRVEMCKARANSVARMRSYVWSTLTDVVAANAGTHTAASIRKLRWQSTFATTAPWDYGSRRSPGRRDPLTSSRRSARTNSRRRGWCGSRRAWSGLARSCGGCA
jgi:hypothetical protein